MRPTDRVVASLNCPPGKRDATFADEAVTGFWLRVQANGGKTFMFRYRVGSVSRRVPLGAFGEVTVAEARKRAERMRGDVLDGRDPWVERRDTRPPCCKPKPRRARGSRQTATSGGDTGIRRARDEQGRL